MQRISGESFRTLEFDQGVYHRVMEYLNDLGWKAKVRFSNAISYTGPKKECITVHMPQRGNGRIAFVETDSEIIRGLEGITARKSRGFK